MCSLFHEKPISFYVTVQKNLMKQICEPLGDFAIDWKTRYLFLNYILIDFLMNRNFDIPISWAGKKNKLQGTYKKRNLQILLCTKWTL